MNIKGLTDYGALKDRIQSNRSEKQSIASPTDLKVLEIRNDLFGSDFRKNQEGSKMTSEFVTPSRDISKTMSRLKIEKPEPEVKDEHRYTIVGNGSSGNHRNSNWEAMNRPTQRNSNENRDHISHLGQFKYSSGKQEQRVPREMNNYSSLSQSQNINSRTIFTEREKQQKFKILSRYISRDFLDPIEGTDLGNRQEFTPNSQASDNLVDEDGFYSGPVERTAEKKRGNFESRIKNVQMDQRFDRLANFDKRYESTDQKEEDNFYYSSRQIHSRQQSPIRSEEEQNVVKGKGSSLLDKFYKKANAEPGRKRLEVPMVEEAELGTASGISGMKDSYLNRVLEKVTRDKSPVHIDRNALLSHRISPLSRKMGRENQPQPQKNNYTPREIARMSAQPNLAFPSFGMDQQFSNKNFNQTSAELNSMNSISTASSKIRIKLDLGSLAQRNLSETGF